MLSMELVGALSKRIRTTLSSVKIRGLNARPDLNGKSATVIGPRNHQTGRVPVRVKSTGECVKAKPKNLWDGSEESDALPTVLELGAGDGHLSHHLAISLSGYAKLICSDTKPPKDAIGWAALSCEIRAMDSRKSRSYCSRRLRLSRGSRRASIGHYTAGRLSAAASTFCSRERLVHVWRWLGDVGYCAREWV